MALKPETKSAMFVRAMRRLREQYNSFEIARWFAMGDEDKRGLRQITVAFNRKLYDQDHPDHRNPTNSDCLATACLDFLDRLGYDLATLRYNEHGEIVELQKKSSD